MGTRSLTHIKEEGYDSETVLTFYRQYDGYPEGHGESVWEILNRGACEIVNGYQMHMDNPNYFNGMGCLAAYLVGKLKLSQPTKTIGGFSIMPNDTSDWGEEYVYTLWTEGGEVYMEVRDIYEGTVEHGLLKEFKSKGSPLFPPPKPKPERVYVVLSSDGVSSYEVTFTDNKGKCTCPDHRYRKNRCKHIQRVVAMHF